MGELALRMVASLAVVVGLLIVAARVAGRRFRGGPGAEIQVLQRQALSKGSQIAVIQVRDRVLVVGATEQQLRLLAELDPQDEAGLAVPAGEAAPESAQESAQEPLATVTPLTLVPGLEAETTAAEITTAEVEVAVPVAEIATAASPEPAPEPAPVSVTDILATATGPYPQFAAPLAEQLAGQLAGQTAGQTAATAASTPRVDPLPAAGDRIAPTDPFAPRIDRPGKHARRVEPELPGIAAAAVAPAVPAVDPALALLTDLDDRAALLDLLAALPTPVEGPLSTPAAAERTIEADPAPRAARTTRTTRAARKAAKAAQAAPIARPAEAAAAPVGPTPTGTTGTDGRLAGSVLSPQTWRQAYQAITGRAS